MIWYVLLFIVLQDNKAVRIQIGHYETKAACEETLKTIKLAETRDTFFEIQGGCTNDQEIKQKKKELKKRDHAD